MIKFTCEEAMLLQKLILNAIRNGNTVSPEPFKPTPKQYKMLHQIVRKLEIKAIG